MLYPRGVSPLVKEFGDQAIPHVETAEIADGLDKQFVYDDADKEFFVEWDSRFPFYKFFDLPKVQESFGVKPQKPL